MESSPFRRRVALSLVLLGGFYATALGLSATLLAIPIVILVASFRSQANVHGNLFLIFAVTWLPALLIAKGTLGARRPRFDPVGKRLARDDAPLLFAMIDDLAVESATRAPDLVYLVPGPSVGVTETGGFLGIGSRRVLMLGAPVLEHITASELRAALAHELGHFIGGETRLAGVVGYTHALFGSVLASVTRRGGTGGFMGIGADAAEFLGTRLVTIYARIYLRLTRPLDRKQELAADALAVKLTGKRALASALEKISVFGPLYSSYLALDVSFAVKNGAMPSDLMDGFAIFRERIAARGDEASLTARVRTEQTDPFDSHPALAERLRAIEALPEGQVREDDRCAIELITASDHAKWLADTTGPDHGPRLARVPWKDVSPFYSKGITSRSAPLVGMLRSWHQWTYAGDEPAMFPVIVAMLARGQIASVVRFLEPTLGQPRTPGQLEIANAFAANVVNTLFEGALVARGATVDASLGEAFLGFMYEGEMVRPGAIVKDAMRGPEGCAVLEGWAGRLEKGGP